MRGFLYFLLAWPAFHKCTCLTLWQVPSLFSEELRSFQPNCWSSVWNRNLMHTARFALHKTVPLGPLGSKYFVEIIFLCILSALFSTVLVYLKTQLQETSKATSQAHNLIFSVRSNGTFSWGNNSRWIWFKKSSLNLSEFWVVQPVLQWRWPSVPLLPMWITSGNKLSWNWSGWRVSTESAAITRSENKQ